MDSALPGGLILYNGGIRCDSLHGPCTCGAWHDIKELPKRCGQDIWREMMGGKTKHCYEAFSDDKLSSCRMCGMQTSFEDIIMKHMDGEHDPSRECPGCDIKEHRMYHTIGEWCPCMDTPWDEG